VNDLRDGEFEERVLRSELPVLVEFWAPWCGPCLRFAPTVAAVAREFRGRLRILRVDTDENPLLPRACGVSSIPTLILFKRGAEVARFAGRQPLERLREGIAAAMEE